MPESEFEEILRVIAGSPEGASVGELLTALEGLKLPRRTLQRRLKRLVSDGRLLAKGEGRGRRYLRPETLHAAELPSVRETSGPPWLGVAAAEVRQKVLRPLAERAPVGYQAGFLQAYEPNVSAYLPAKIRQHLAEVGQVGITDLPAGTYVRRLLDRLLIDLSWNSSRLEGNTYSLLETQRLLDWGEVAEGKAAEEAQMILNHKAAMEMLAGQAEELGFNRYTICNLHALLSDNLLPDPAACGRLRTRPVGIAGSVFHPLEMPQQIESQLQELLEKAEAIEDPIEQAFFAMVHLPYLQPFEDVNKRVSRLAANIPLIRHNLCPLSFIDVPQDDYVSGLLGVYELKRVEYLRDVFVWAYQRSAARYSAVRQSLGDPDPFRLRYRSQIGELVRSVVQGGMGKAEATRWIAEHAARELPEPDRARFTEVVETELDSLHSGSIARFRLLPDVFARWRDSWT